ncbi:MAG: hypothetical protein GTO55_06150, partial [Armatimonadetes bacterium]|nr:hypothetical protein [Armatimonadota bacterium]NIM23833.1 hypothetical protein [Armatimonadota bacterium]NIM67712.1 hypothetical protein [Armatimonadota bacterium]NIM76221.1 hypothetical protein [Armatimonadota bacterium]NIN05914.1 hypothetical protein [Armatimonadota bacterium]
GREITLPRESLLHPQFCYIALGHAHRFQDLNAGKQPPLVYCGSPERVDFSEAEEPKGFVIVEIKSVQSSGLSVQSVDQQLSTPNSQLLPAAASAKAGSTHYEFVETPARRFVTMDVNLKPGEGTAEVLEEIAARQTEDAVVKVILRSQEEATVDEREIRRALADAHFVTPVSREIENPPARLRAPGLVQGWENPLSALEEYLKTTSLSEERKARLRTAAAKLTQDTSRRA